MSKNVLLGITGGIAVYKILDVASSLRKKGYEINTIMTKNATEFVTPLTFETITHNYVVTDTFARPETWEVEHIALAKKADVVLIAPATANIIGKVANGIADDMLSTTIMATKAKVIFAPAMNTGMYENPILQENIAKLKRLGYLFIEPDAGWLACGDLGKGKLPKPEVIEQYVLNVFNTLGDDNIVNERFISGPVQSNVEVAQVTESANRDLEGVNVLVSAGPTIEPIDPFRYITNHSSGKMGYSIAEDAAKRGANVTLVSGPTSLDCPIGVSRINVKTTEDMYKAMHENFATSDIVIKAAAVSDYRPKEVSTSKIKKKDENLSLELTLNPDILKSLGEIKEHQVLVGFAAETDNLIEYATKKIETKNLDIIVANNISSEGAGFKGDTNIVTIIEKDGNITEYSKMYKSELGNVILDKAKMYLNTRR